MSCCHICIGCLESYHIRRSGRQEVWHCFRIILQAPVDQCGAMEDWQKARDWLKNEKLTKATVKVQNYTIFKWLVWVIIFQYFNIERLRQIKLPCQVPNLSEIRTEFELYTYLKDGTELCRAIGLATQGRVLDGIFYRLELCYRAK